jgi:hypothetical protein
MILIGFLNIILLKVNLNEKKNLQKKIFALDRSPRKSPSQRKSRQTNSDVDGASGTGAASSENDE